MYTQATMIPSMGNYQTGRDFGKVNGMVNADLSQFFQRYLLQKAFSVFRWTLPKQWSKEYFLYTLYVRGFLAVINTDKFGVIPQGCALQGFDVMYQPTNAVITNPLLKGITTPRIGVQCALIKLQPDYCGIMDLVTYYGDMMALTCQTAGVNLVNSQLSYVFTAENKASAESFRKMYTKIASGEAFVIQDNKMVRADGTPAWQLFQQNVGQNYIAGQLYDDLRKLEQRFDTTIGIPNANTEKRERLITDEVNANNIETRTLAESWLEELQTGVEKSNTMFNLQLAVDWRHDPGKEVPQNDGERPVKQS